MADALRNFPQMYAGDLSGQTPAPRKRTTHAHVPADGITREELSEIMGRLISGSAEFLGALGEDPEVARSPASLATLARNLRDLAEMLDAGADGLHELRALRRK